MQLTGMKSVLTATEAAEYLMVSRATMVRLAKSGQVGRKVGKLWRFRRDDLDRYISHVVVSDSANRGASNEQVSAGNP